MKKLGEVVELRYGKGIEKSRRVEEGEVPIYGANGILGWTNDELAEGEAIIVGRKGSAGELTRVSGKFWPSDVTYYVFGTDEVDIDYLFYFWKSANLPRLATGVKPGINRNQVYEIEIPVPPIEEQRKIVEKIEKQFAKIDEAARLRADSLAATDQLLPAALHEIFSEGKQKGWEVQTLGEICEIARGGSPRPIQSFLTEDKDGINWVKISDATSSTKYIYETKQKIKKEGLTKTRLVKPGDFILTNSMSFGRPYIMKTTGAIHDGWLLLRPKKNLIEEFMYYFLSSDEVYEQFKRLAGGAVVQNLNSNLVRSVEIAIPPLAEQKEVVKKLDALSEKARALRTLQLAQQSDLAALKQSLLHEAFAGGVE